VVAFLYASRLPRGRAYVRNGSVVDLQLAAGKITAAVSGSELYDVAVAVAPVAPTRWRAVRADCAGGIDSLVELLRSRLSEGTMQRICAPACSPSRASSRCRVAGAPDRPREAEPAGDGEAHEGQATRHGEAASQDEGARVEATRPEEAGQAHIDRSTPSRRW
jgi:hypothetical protein